MKNDGPVTAWLRRAARELSAAAFVCGVAFALLVASDKKPVSAGQATPTLPPGFVLVEPAGALPKPTLAQTIRSLSPGDYDDLSDQELERLVLAKHPPLAQAIRAKYPGAYDDLSDQEIEQDVYALPRSGGRPQNSVADQLLERAAAADPLAFLWGAMVGAVPLWAAYRFARFVIGR
jgi:hypothetical protein